MIKTPRFLLAISLCIVHCALYIGVADAAVPQIRRADAVQEQQQAPLEAAMGGGGGNLLGTAVGLIGGAMQLRNISSELTRECEPSAADITFVNDMMRAYAMSGGRDPRTFIENAQLGDQCVGGYTEYRRLNNRECFTTFGGITGTAGTADQNRIWSQYPRAEMTQSRICPPNRPNCNIQGGEGSHFTNMYLIWNTMNWQEADLMPGEIAGFARITERAQRCEPRAVRARVQQQGMQTVMGMVQGIGQPGTATTADAVMGLMHQTGGGQGNQMLQGVMGMAPALLPAITGGM